MLQNSYITNEKQCFPPPLLHLTPFLYGLPPIFTKKSWSSLLSFCKNVKYSTYYFRIKTKILTDFQICISVPLICSKLFACSDMFWKKVSLKLIYIAYMWVQLVQRNLGQPHHEVRMEFYFIFWKEYFWM